MSRAKVVITAAVLVFSATLVYWRALDSPFQFDDEVGIVENPAIQDPSDLKAVLTYKSDLPRPLFNLTLAADFAIGRFDPLVYHVTNLLIHLAGAFLVWWLAAEVGVLAGFSKDGGPLERAGPAMAAFIFAIHPIATEPTIYIWSRSSSLMAVLCLASLALYLKACRSGRGAGWLIASFAAFLAAVLSKEEAVTFPLLLLAADIVLLPADGRKKRLIWQAPFWLVPAAAVVYRMAAGLTMYDLISWRVTEADNYSDLLLRHSVPRMFAINLFTQLKLGLYQFFVLLWPVNQSVDHGVVFEEGMPGFWVYAGALFTAAAVALFFIGRKQWPRAALAAAFFFVPLSLFYVVPVSDAFVERRLYLPLAGWAILLGASLARGAGRLKRPAVGGALFLVLPAVMLGALTYSRAEVWGDRLGLWSDAARVSPDKLRPHIMLGRYSYESGNIYRAVHEYQAAIRVKENYGPAIVNLGLIYLNAGELKTAERYFRMAVHYHPGSDFSARYNLALTLNKMGRDDEALNEYRETLRMSPAHVAAQQGLGNLLIKMGREAEGIAELEKAAKIAPANGVLQCNLGFAFLQAGRIADAEKAFKKGSQDPASPEAWYGMAQVRIIQKRFDEARSFLETFVKNTDTRKRPELEYMVKQAQQLLGR